MGTNSLDAIMDGVAQRMHADFRSSTSIQHRSSRGTDRERLVADFVRGYLPGHVQLFHGGEIVLVEGETSKQCDLLVCDRAAPPLKDLESFRIVPAECVYGVIEVKTKLTGSELVIA